MNTSQAEKLLQSVSPSLTAGYEMVNLHGRTLCSIYKEYIDVVLKRKKISFYLPLFLIISLVVVGVGAACYFTTFPETKPLEAIMIIAVIGAVCIYLLIYPLQTRLWKYNDIINKSDNIFNKFEQSVKGLDPYFVMTNRIYTAEYTHEFLVDLAVRWLGAEKKFKVKRLKENELTLSILEAGNREEKCRKEFEKLLENAEKFGLVFNKTELFASARARSILDETMMS